VLVGAIMLATIRGLALGKWVHNACGAMLIVAFAALILLPVLNLFNGTLSEYRPFEAALPTFTLLNVNIFSKLALGALSGLEYVAIVSGECRDPSRTIGRSVVIATPLITLMFVLGTSAVLAFVGPGEVDLISPIPQVLSLGFRPFGIASIVAPVAILMLLSRSIGNVSMTFTGNTRLPMVAGWDELLPGWFARIHPRYKTPVNSALFVGAVTFALGIVSLVGVGEQEAFQLLDNAAGVFYAMAYVALFAVPLFGLRASGERVPAWLKALSACGMLVTLLYIALSVFPIVEVESWLLYGVKISGVIVVANLAGVALYAAAARRRASLAGGARPDR
jgi:amino acid transporter